MATNSKVTARDSFITAPDLEMQYRNIGERPFFFYSRFTTFLWLSSALNSIVSSRQRTMAATSFRKRKLDDTQDPLTMKKVKSADGSAVPVISESATNPAPQSEGAASASIPVEVPQNTTVAEINIIKPEKGKKRATPSADDEKSTNGTDSRKRIRKLAPPRPFPTVPTSMNATGPRSTHVEGKNYICITRKTPLGAYLRRCKDLILKDGYVSIVR